MIARGAHVPQIGDAPVSPWLKRLLRKAGKPITTTPARLFAPARKRKRPMKKTDATLITAKAMCQELGAGCLCLTPNPHGFRCIAQNVFGMKAAAITTRLDEAGFLREPAVGWRKALRRAWDAYERWIDRILPRFGIHDEEPAVPMLEITTHTRAERLAVAQLHRTREITFDARGADPIAVAKLNAKLKGLPGT